MKTSVICIGGAAVDITVGPVDSGSVFHNMVNFVSDISVCVGGDALNESMTLAKLGHDTSLISCVGEDALGGLLLSEIEKAGVKSTYMHKTQDYPTTGIVCLTGENDQRNFLFKEKSAVNRLNTDCIDREAVKAAKVMTFGSLLFCDGFTSESLLALFKEAKENGAITVADVAVMDENIDNMAQIKDVLPYVDYIFPNYDEACTITGESDPEKIADVFLNAGVKNTIVKLGSKGCLFKGERGKATLGCYRVPVVNTTGAGDNFLAGFVSGLMDELPLKDCLLRGTATAALTIQSVGASTGVKNMEQVKAFMSANEAPVYTEF